MKKYEAIIGELKEHLPFTLGASLFAGVLVALAYFFELASNGLLVDSFEIVHPLHVLFSAAATAAVFRKYKGSIFGALLSGIFGSILIGTISDVLLPWAAGNLFYLNTYLHLPILEEPFKIFGSALIGSYIGIYFGMFKFNHSFHIFLSVFASLFYLLAFSDAISALEILGYSFIVFLTVYIPCCVSDIVFPIFFVDRECKKCGHWHS